MNYFSKMKTQYKISWIFMLSIIIISCNNEPEKIDTDISIPVSINEIKLGSIEKYITTTGTVYPTKEVELKSEIAGDYNLQINPNTKKKYALGDYVQMGSLIIKIENQEYYNNLRIESQKLNLDISQQTLEKQKSLYEKGGVSQLDLKNSEVDYVNAKYSYDDTQLQLTKMFVKAPFSGVIVDLPHNTSGIRLDAGSSLLKIMDYKKMFLEVNFPEKQMGDVKLNTMVRITNYTLPDDTIFGRITAISPAIDPETRTFKSSLQLDNVNLKFRPGMFVKADLVIAKRDSAIVIPKDVILSKQKGKTIFIVQRGAAVEKIIRTGLENPDQVEVLEGLEVNDRLVVTGFETLANRSKVSIVQ